MHAPRSDTEKQNRQVWCIPIMFLKELIWLEIQQCDTKPRKFKQT